MRERVQVEVRLEVPNALLKPGIDDWRGEEPQRQHVGENVANVPKVHRERRQQERECRRKHQLDDDGDREPEQVRRPGIVLRVHQEGDENGQSEEEVHHVRQHADERQDFRGKQDLSYEVPTRDERPGGVGQRRRKPVPGKDAAEHEEGKRLRTRCRVGDDFREHKRVNQQEQKRIDE